MTMSRTRSLPLVRRIPPTVRHNDRHRSVPATRRTPRPLHVVRLALMLFAVLGAPPRAWAHGISDVEGSFEVEPVGARPGDLAELRVTLTSPHADALQGGARVEVKVSAGGQTAVVALEPLDARAFSGRIVLREGFHDVRVRLQRGERREFAMMGFHVAPGLLPLRPDEGQLWFVPQGRFDALPWLDNVAGAAVGVGVWAAILALVRRGRPGASRPGPHGKPVAALAAAVLGVIAMPLGGFWDISFHSESGRESFFSAPHLLIYGGILLSLAVVAASVGRRADGTAWRDHLRADPAAAVAAAGMCVQLGSAPFDELWHGLFGLDVSVWSPPHAVLIAGGIIVGLALSSIRIRREGAVVDALRALCIAGALLAGEVFLAEFVYPFPAWHASQARPTLIYPAFLTSFALLAALVARQTLRYRWGAVLAAMGFLGLRLLVDPLLAIAGRKVAPALSPWLALTLLVAFAIDLGWKRPRAAAG